MWFVICVVVDGDFFLLIWLFLLFCGGIIDNLFLIFFVGFDFLIILFWEFKIRVLYLVLLGWL